MIEDTLRSQLAPVISRRRRLYLARTLAVYWLVGALIGIAMIVVGRLSGWTSTAAVGGLCVIVAGLTLAVYLRSRRMQPDYKAVARDIEQKNPELRALLLAAVEQEPEGPDGRYNYLQRQVLIEALAHATGHDWTQSVSNRQLLLAGVGRVAALLLLLVVLAHALPSGLPLLRGRRGPVAADVAVTVTPGDIAVELGSPVVVLARFERSTPTTVDLVYGGRDGDERRMPLTRSMSDPVFGGIIQDVNCTMRYHVEYGSRRTRQYTISVYQTPELLRADARIVYPSYTNLPERVIEDTRQVSVVERSEVTLRLTLNKPVQHARLVPRSGIALGLAVDAADPNVLVTSLTALESERYELRLTDAEGRSNKVPPRFVIDVHQNLPPEVTPIFPNRDVVVSPLEELTLEAAVSDDYGITGYGLTFTLVGAPSRDVVLGREPVAGDEPQIRHVLALEDLGAEPDQLLTYHFWADDVGPDGTSRRTASDIYFAEVRPFEEIFRESQSAANQQNRQQGQQQQGGQADELLRLQKQIITATWNIKQRSDRSGSVGDAQDDLDVVRQSQADALAQTSAAMGQAQDPSAVQALDAAAGHMETSVQHLTEAGTSDTAAPLASALSTEQLAYRELLKLREREHQIARNRNAGRRSNANSAQFDRQLQQLELTQEENRYETQRLARSQRQEAQREDLQVLNRLRDLARRQNETSERLREAQAKLEQARDEQERQKALRRLKRLREEQLAALEDVDELERRMETPENRRRMADARNRLNDSRSRIRQSAEALQEGMVSQAITSATRAQRDLEQMRDEFRRRTSGQFSEEMRDLREHAQELDRRQEQIADEMRQEIDVTQKRLSGSEVNRDLADRVERQRQRLEALLEEMRSVTEEAEASEPLLSRKLYETLRRTRTKNVDRALEAAGELLERNFLPQAQEFERRAAEGIGEIREGVEEAARNVLGDEAESLRLARQQLDDLIRQVDEEAARAAGTADEPNDDPNAPAVSGPASPRLADARSSRVEEEPQRQTGDQQQQSQRPGAPRGTPQRRSLRADRTPRGQRQGGMRSGGGLEDPRGQGGGDVATARWSDRGPLTGDDYLEWSDRLRDIEEILGERELRNEAARVRDRARAMRAEFTRHGTEPQWDLVRGQIIEPLDELRRRIADELAQLESDDAMVPIDRDPVPDRFAEAVRHYFENLGEEK